MSKFMMLLAGLAVGIIIEWLILTISNFKKLTGKGHECKRCGEEFEYGQKVAVFEGNRYCNECCAIVIDDKIQALEEIKDELENYIDEEIY